MAMIDAGDPGFWDRFPHGAVLRDRWGRLIPNVIACNPKTGEVIAYDATPLTAWWMTLVHLVSIKAWRLRFLGARLYVEVSTVRGINWTPSSTLLRRHGFWPAPLTLAAMPPVPPRHIMCRCALEPINGGATEADPCEVMAWPGGPVSVGWPNR